MKAEIPVFKTSKDKADYNAAHEAVLKKWPVHYDELSVLTKFGDTHIIASGPFDSIPLVLLRHSPIPLAFFHSL